MSPPDPLNDATVATASAAVSVAGPLLLVEGLGKAFETPEGAVTAVDGVSFAVAKGEIVSLIGPSGCGKSTVFNIIGGLTPASLGRVRIDGEAVSGPHAAIGMVFQEESTLPWRTVVDNVAFPLEIAGVRRRERLQIAAEFVKLVGLFRVRAALSGRAVGRHAPARVDRPRAGLQAEDPAMGAVSCFFPVALGVAAGMRRIDAVLIRVGKSFRASAIQMALKIYLPAIRAPVVTSFRLGLGVAVIGVLLAETKLSNRGLGFMVIDAYARFDMPAMYALVIVIFVLAVGLNTGLSYLARERGRSPTPGALG